VGESPCSPDVTFVLDHAGKPAVGAGEWEPWASWLAESTELPNVSCTLFGPLKEATPNGRGAETLRLYARVYTLQQLPPGSARPLAQRRPRAGAGRCCWATNRRLAGPNRATRAGGTGGSHSEKGRLARWGRGSSRGRDGRLAPRKRATRGMGSGDSRGPDGRLAPWKGATRGVGRLGG